MVENLFWGGIKSNVIHIRMLHPVVTLFTLLILCLLLVIMLYVRLRVVFKDSEFLLAREEECLIRKAGLLYISCVLLTVFFCLSGFA